ncbi:MAG: prolyl oligopeptidase family serine peptidase [Pirellulaceae bacterium]|nr:prolyl oligopeptidase family serine peptidase [Pirellulaceae bacterium]
MPNSIDGGEALSGDGRPIRIYSKMALTALILLSDWETTSMAQELKWKYPPTAREGQVDDYHGTSVADPYRWLEETDSERTKAWIAAQNEVTFQYLQQIPSRQKLEDRLTKLWNYERYGLPVQRGGRYFYTHNDGLQNQSVLFVADGMDSTPRVLLDPNVLSEEGTVALVDWVPSEDGRLIAIALASAGSDWRQWKVLDVASRELLPDLIEWSKFSSVAWTSDGVGFFYSRYDAPREGDEFTGTNYFQKLYYHVVGQSQDLDTLVYERPDQKKWGFSSFVTEDGNYLVITVWRGTEDKYQIFYKDLTLPAAEVVELITGFDAEYVFVANDNARFWFMTDLDAPLRRVIAIDVTRPERGEWQELIPETQNVLRRVSRVGDKLFASYLQHAHSLVKVHALDGTYQHDVTLPAIGSVGGFAGRSTDRECFYAFSNFVTPSRIYRYSLESGASEIFRQPDVDFDPADFITEQIFFSSKDGTRVPMFITRKRELSTDTAHPTILYGYGGFNNSLTPGFQVSNMVWLEAGGVFAVPNLRGGGEYGRAWHEAGMLNHKQNVFDDFIAAAEWLIDNRLSSPAKLAIRGGSNGGLLVGAVMTQSPELFQAAVPAVGVMDMLRYHKFTIGWAWVSEYGSSDNSHQFPMLLKYSPLHNLCAGTDYPATLITTGDHDDRVVPGHSFKFAANLQYCHSGADPVFIRVETRAGHGAGTPTHKRIEAAADVLAFLFEQLQLEL